MDETNINGYAAGNSALERAACGSRRVIRQFRGIRDTLTAALER
jgi:hypothetical protein